ncbi:MAG: transcriptional repressor [Planctomycetota bacterium]
MTERESTEAMKDLIRAAGLRATPARLATLRLLQESGAPVSHAEVAEKLSSTGVDKATAFRNLNDLAEAGLLRRSELGDHVYRFEIFRPGESRDDQHPHFFCTECGTVSCLESVKLTARSKRESDKIGTVTEILLRGRCHQCAK